MDIEALCSKVKKKIAEDFEVVHLSGNLVATMYVENMKDGKRIVIPARRYNEKRYKQTGSIVYYPGQRSYASVVDYVGGRSKRKVHKDFATRCTEEAINEWLKEQGMEAKIKDE